MERGPPLPDSSLLAHATVNQVNEYAHELSTRPVNLNDTIHHYLYGLYKQAVEGDCHDDPPPLFALMERDQFDAWMNNHGMDPTVASANYICAAKVVLAGQLFDPYSPPSLWLPFSSYRSSSSSSIPASPAVSSSLPSTPSTTPDKGINTIPSPVRFPSTTFPQTSPPSYRNQTMERTSSSSSVLRSTSTTTSLTSTSANKNSGLPLHSSSSSDTENTFTTRKPFISTNSTNDLTTVSSTNDISMVSTTESIVGDTEADDDDTAATSTTLHDTTVGSILTTTNNDTSANENDTSLTTNDNDDDDLTLSHGFPIAGLFLTPTSVFAGWMLKKREKISIFTSQRWRRRWVVLTGRQLRYYASQSDAAHEARDIIYLANGVTIDCDPVPTGTSLSSMKTFTSTNKNDTSNISSSTATKGNSASVDPKIGLETGENRPIGRFRSVASAVARSVAITKAISPGSSKNELSKKPSLASAVLAAATASNRKDSISSDSEGGDDDYDDDSSSRPRGNTTVGNTTIITSTKPPDKVASPPVTFRIRHQQSKKEYCFAIWGMSALEDRERWVVVLRAATSGFLVDPATKTDDNVVLRKGLKVKNTKAVILQSPSTTKPNPVKENGKKIEDSSSSSAKPKTPALLAAVQALKKAEGKTENTPIPSDSVPVPAPTPASIAPEKVATPKVGLLALAKAMKKQQEEEKEKLLAKDEQENEAKEKVVTVVLENTIETTTKETPLLTSVETLPVPTIIPSIVQTTSELSVPSTAVTVPVVLQSDSNETSTTGKSTASPTTSISSPSPSLVPAIPSTPVNVSVATEKASFPQSIPTVDIPPSVVVESTGPPPYVLPSLPSEPQLSIVRRLLAQCNDAAISTKGWKKTGIKNDITCYVSEDGSPACRGEGFIPFPRTAIFELISKLETRKMTDTQFDWGENILDWNVHTKLTHLIFHGFRPIVAQRDLLLLVYWKIEPDGTLIMVSTSYDDEKLCPLIDGVVRAHLHIGGWILRPRPGINALSETIKKNSKVPLYTHPDIEKEGCDVTYFMRTDLKGDIPSWLVSRITAQQAGIVGVVRDKLNEFYGKNGSRGGMNGLKALVPMVNVYNESKDTLDTDNQAPENVSINKTAIPDTPVTITKTDITPPTSSKAASTSTAKMNTPIPVATPDSNNGKSGVLKGVQFSIPDQPLPPAEPVSSTVSKNGASIESKPSSDKPSKGKKSLASLISTVSTKGANDAPMTPSSTTTPTPTVSDTLSVVPSPFPSSSAVEPKTTVVTVPNESITIVDKCFGTTNPILAMKNEANVSTTENQTMVDSTVDQTRRLIYSFINPNDKTWKHYMPPFLDDPDQQNTSFVLVKDLLSGNFTNLLSYIPNSDVVWSRENVLGSFRSTKDSISTRFDTIVDIAPSTLCSLIQDNGFMQLVESKDTRLQTIKEYNACNRLLKCTWTIHPHDKQGSQTFTSNIVQHVRILEDWEVHFNIPAILITETCIPSKEQALHSQTSSSTVQDIPSSLGLTKVWLIRPLVHSSYQYFPDSLSLVARSAVTHLTFYNNNNVSQTKTSSSSSLFPFLSLYSVAQRYQFMERFRSILYYGLQSPQKLSLPNYNSVGNYILQKRKTKVNTTLFKSTYSEKRLSEELQFYSRLFQQPVDQMIKSFSSLSGMYRLLHLPFVTYNEQRSTFKYPAYRKNKAGQGSVLAYVGIALLLQIITLLLSGLLTIMCSPMKDTGIVLSTVIAIVVLWLIMQANVPWLYRTIHLWILLPLYLSIDSSYLQVPLDLLHPIFPRNLSTDSVACIFRILSTNFPQLSETHTYIVCAGITGFLLLILESLFSLNRTDSSLSIPDEYQDNRSRESFSGTVKTVIENYRRKQNLSHLSTIVRSSKVTFDGSLFLYYTFVLTEKYGTVFPLSLPLLMGKLLTTVTKSVMPLPYFENNNTDVMFIYPSSLLSSTVSTGNGTQEYTYSMVTNMDQQSIVSTMYVFSRSCQSMVTRVPGIVIICEEDDTKNTNEPSSKTTVLSKELQSIVTYAPLVIYLSSLRTVREPNVSVSLATASTTTPYIDFSMEINVRQTDTDYRSVVITELRKLLNNYSLWEQSME